MAVSPGNLNVVGKGQNFSAGDCFQSQNTVLQGQPFGGIPTVLCLNVILWVVIILVYSFLRKAAWDYGRLALLIHNDSLTSLIYGEQSEKTSPSDISLEMEHKDKGFYSWFFNTITMNCQDGKKQNLLGRRAGFCSQPRCPLQRDRPAAPSGSL